MRRFAAAVVVAALALGGIAAAGPVAQAAQVKDDTARVKKACAAFAAYPTLPRLEALLDSWGPQGSTSVSITATTIVNEPGGTQARDEKAAVETARYDARGNSHRRQDWEDIYLNGMSYTRWTKTGKWVKKKARNPRGTYGVSLDAYDVLQGTSDFLLYEGQLTLNPDGSVTGLYGDAPLMGRVVKGEYLELDDAFTISADCRQIDRVRTVSWMPVAPGTTSVDFTAVNSYYTAVTHYQLFSGPAGPIKAPPASMIKR